MPRRRSTSHHKSESDLVDVTDACLPFVAGFAVVLPIFPGFLLCVPGLVLAAIGLVLVVVPALIVSVVVALVAIPLRLATGAHRAWLSRRAAAGASASRERPGLGSVSARRQLHDA